MSIRTRKSAAALAVTAVISLFASACTGLSGSAANDDPNAKTTITFWHGWSARSEVKAIQENIARFEKALGNIKVKIVGNMTGRQDQPGAARRRFERPGCGELLHHRQRGQVLHLRCLRRSQALPGEVEDRPDEGLPQAAARLHAVRGQSVLAAATSTTRTASTKTRTPSRPPGSPHRGRPGASSRRLPRS